MKRAPIVLAGTALGLAGALGYNTAASKPTGGAGLSTGSATTPTTTAAPSTAKKSRTTSTAGKSSGTRSATGQDVSFQFGDVQLKVTMTGSRLTDVSVAQLNPTDPRSQSIDQSAVPQLQQQALSAQSAQIDGVSGASYTSTAYEQALQSALDKVAATNSAQ